jgi:hypothetical protein
MSGGSGGIPNQRFNINMDAGAGAPVQQPMSSLAQAGLILSIYGALQNAVGSFYEAKTQKYQLKSQQLSAQFQSTMSAINARAAEAAADAERQAGERQIGQYTMQAGQQKASAQASLAARGVQAGVGSTAEIMATGDIVKEIDVLTINANALRAAEAAQTQAINYRAQSTMAGLSARNLGVSAGSIKPGMQAFSTLLGSAGQTAYQWSVARTRGAYASDF